MVTDKNFEILRFAQNDNVLNDERMDEVGLLLRRNLTSSKQKNRCHSERNKVKRRI